MDAKSTGEESESSGEDYCKDPHDVEVVNSGKGDKVADDGEDKSEEGGMDDGSNDEEEEAVVEKVSFIIVVVVLLLCLHYN